MFEELLADLDQAGVRLQGYAPDGEWSGDFAAAQRRLLDLSLAATLVPDTNVTAV